MVTQLYLATMFNLRANIGALLGSADCRRLDFSLLYIDDHNLASVVSQADNEKQNIHKQIFSVLSHGHLIGILDDDEYTSLMAYATTLWQPTLRLYALTHKKIKR